MWRTIRGQRVDDLREFLRATLADGERRVDIGTDSLNFGRRTVLVTVVTLIRPGKGGRAVYKCEVTPRIASLRQRLAREVGLSLQVAFGLGDVLASATDLTIHVDANPAPEHRSSRFVHELVGMVVGQGFRVAIKPQAWAATCVADHIARIYASRERLRLRAA